MRNNWGGPAAAAAVLAVSLGLLACGDGGFEGAEMDQPGAPNVEINRQGTEGAGAAESDGLAPGTTG